MLFPAERVRRREDRVKMREERERESKSYPPRSDSSTHSHAMVPLPAELLVCTEISPSLLALAMQADHVAPEGSLAPPQIHQRVFLPPALTFTSSHTAFLRLFLALCLRVFLEILVSPSLFDTMYSFEISVFTVA